LEQSTTKDRAFFLPLLTVGFFNRLGILPTAYRVHEPANEVSKGMKLEREDSLMSSWV
jgi:hypothetical protein